MADRYSEVEISPEEMASLTKQPTKPAQTTESDTTKNAEPGEDTKQATVPEAKAAKEEPTPTKDAEPATRQAETSQQPESPTAEDQPFKFEHDGKSYSRTDLVSALSDSLNKADWQKTTTQKAQALAAAKDLLELILEDADEFEELVTDSKKFTKLVDKAKSVLPDIEEAYTPARFRDKDGKAATVPPEVQELKAEVDAIKRKQSEEAIAVEFADFTTKHEDYFKDGKAIDPFLKYMDDNHLTNFDAAYKQYRYDDLQEELAKMKKLNKNREKNASVSVQSGERSGVKETKSPPKTRTDYKQIKADDPDIKAYGLIKG